MQIIVDGLATHYERLGTDNNRSVIILPGWADSSVSWKPLQKELAKSFDVIVLDLPGFGGSQQPKRAWGLVEYAGFVSQFLAKLNVRPYALIGHSNGGAMAIKTVASGLLTPSKLVLLSAAGIRDKHKGRNKALWLLAKTGKALTSPLPARTKQALRQKLYASAGSDMLVAEHMQETFKRVVSEDVQRDVSAINVQTLLVYGQRDTDTPPSFGRTYKSLLPEASFVELPGAGHWIHTENTAAVFHYVEEFLA